MALKNAITEMRKNQLAGGDYKNQGIDQNGYSEPSYDEKGRDIGSKAGIVTVPTDLTPRQRFVDKKESVATAYPVDTTTPPAQEPGTGEGTTPSEPPAPPPEPEEETGTEA